MMARNELIDLLEKKKGSFAAVMPKHMTPERMVKLALLAGSRQPDLFKCTPASVLQSLMVASQLGLEPGGPLAQCHLVPYRNKKTGKKEATFIAGYKGLIELAMRSGKISAIDSHVVHERDSYSIRYGTNQELTHTPYLEGDPGPMIAVYAIAFLPDGTSKFDAMRKDEVDAIMKRSKAKDDGPWKTDYEQMARKTVIKRLCNYLPQSPELATAIEVDSRSEADEKMPISDLIDFGGVIDVVDEEKPANLQPPKRKSETKTDEAETEVQPNDPSKPISEAQKKMLEALISKCALTREEIKEALGVESITDLTMGRMNEAIKMISDNTMREPGEEG